MDRFKQLFSTGALKSWTFWAGALQLAVPVVSALSAGTFSVEMLWPVVTGLVTLAGRANPDIKPLADK